MKSLIKKILRILFHRVVLVVLFLLIQLVALFGMVYFFNEYFIYFYAFSFGLSICVVLRIANGKSNPGYKIAWIIPIMLFPVFGGLFYLIFGGNQLSRREKRKMHVMAKNIAESLVQREEVSEAIKKDDENAANISRYIANYAFCPAYAHTSSEYLSLGEVKFERLKEELSKAKHYIFLEYFIIQEGQMWNTVLDILCQKVLEGVDVRVIYDDMGCLMTLPGDYKRTLENLGIQCEVFNKFIPVLSSRLNNRDHRKICVIDGHTGFTGGINLADEYINAYPKHGHWKDTAVMLKGDAVWSLTVMFLSMWDYIRGIEEDFEKYRPHIHLDRIVETDGYVQPYTDNPLDHEPVGEIVYLNLINKAKRFVYITTPYLIVDNEMVTALSIAAKSGVDVRIITPHIADKWYVHAVTRAYYETLLENGVRIYEYTPGFIHAKTFVVDDEYSVVGTINLDYRSLYLHFECATLFYRSSCIAEMKRDFLNTLKVCQPVTLGECRNLAWYKRFGRAILKLFAPLM